MASFFNEKNGKGDRVRKKTSKDDNQLVNNLVVEETDALLDESDAELLSGLEDRGVVLATGRGSNVLDA